MRSLVSDKENMITSGWLLLMAYLLLGTTSTPVRAFVPPKPGTDLASTYEPVSSHHHHHHHHHHNSKQNNTRIPTTKALHPEMCRYLTREECLAADESMYRYQQNHRNIQRQLMQDKRKQQQQKQQEAGDGDGGGLGGVSSQDSEMEFQKIMEQFVQSYTTTGQERPPTREEELEELEMLLKEYNQTLVEQADRWLQQQRQEEEEEQATTTVPPVHNPRVGTFNVLVLLVRFTDHQNRQLPEPYEYQILWNLRIRKWLIQNSYGNYNVFFEVRPWQTTDKTEYHYAFGQSGRVAAFQESYWPLLDNLDNDPNWDWSRFDVNNDGLLDNLIVLHSGYAAEEGGQDCTNGREYLDRIWSHAFSDSNGWRSADGAYGVEGYMIASALDTTCDANPAKMGVMTHEFLHTFYLIDLYDYSFEGKGVGQFDLMAYPYGFNNDGYIPVSLSAWGKTAIDWLTCEIVTSSGTYTLEPSVLAPSCYRVNLRTSEEGLDEYLLFENRQQMGFDVNFWGSGVVIYHIDDAADEQYERGYPGQGNWPYNGKHYQVAVLQADGLYDLEKNVNLGDVNDLWMPGTKLTPNYDGNTFPNSDSYQNGDVQKTGVTVEILESSGSNLNLKITLAGRSGPPAVFSAPERDNPGSSSTAHEQFDVSDSDGLKISGKVPQLPWRSQFSDMESASGKTSSSSSGGGGRRRPLFSSSVLIGGMVGSLLVFF